jgi:hypothetical protein
LWALARLILKRKGLAVSRDDATAPALLALDVLYFFSENRCQKNGFAYTGRQMVVIKGPDVKKLTISLLHV